MDQRFAQHALRLKRIAALRVFIHHPGEQLLIETAPVDADAHRLAIAARHIDHLRKIIATFGATPDVARIDAVLRQRLCARRKLRQQLVAVVVKIADQRNIESHFVQLLANRRDFGRSLGRVDRDADNFRSGLRELFDLNRGRDRVGGIGIGHRLHHHRRIAADANLASSPFDRDLPRPPPRRRLRGLRQAVRQLDRPVHRWRSYLMVKRATLLRVNGFRLNAAPRTSTDAKFASPITTVNGSSPSRACS